MKGHSRSSYQTTGIDGSGVGADVECEELVDIDSVYTPYDQYASNDHLPPFVDTPYGIDSAYPLHMPREDDTPPGSDPFTTVTRMVEVPLHDAQRAQLVINQAPNRWFTRSIALQLATAGPSLYVPQKAVNRDPRRSRITFAVGTGADKQVWISHEVLSPSNIPGPYAFPIGPGQTLTISTTDEVWAIADPTAAVAPQLYVIEETRR